MINLVHSNVGLWENYHHTQSRPNAIVWALADSGAPAAAAAFFRDSAAASQQLLAQGQRVLTLGAKWSFSDLLRSDAGPQASGQGRLFGPNLPNRIFRVVPTMLANTATVPAERLVLAPGSTRISELNDFLEKPGPGTSSPQLALFTSGAHNGQSIAGMMATGTHGSVIGYGAFQNQVRGIHIVTAPDSSIWLERGTPQMSDAFVAALGATRRLETDLFDAALVHLGGLGVINAVLIEADEDYDLAVVRRMPLLRRDSIAQLQAGDFEGFARQIWPYTDPPPHYVEVTLNPLAPYDERSALPAPAMVTLYYKAGPSAGFLGSAHRSLPYLPANDPLNAISRAIGENMPHDWEEQFLPPEVVIAWVMTQFATKMTPLLTRTPELRTWGQLNGAHTPTVILGQHMDLFNAAYAVPRDRLAEALDLLLDVFAARPAPVVYTLRFVHRAAGLMAFTRFDDTVVINMDGLRTASSIDAAVRAALALETEGIPFSQHWGKQGVITPTRLRNGFGDPSDPTTRAGRWRAARQALLPAAMRPLLDNDALHAWGLI